MKLLQEVTNKEKIFPACLPTQQRTSTEGFQSGWSKPMPERYLQNHAPAFLDIYDKFYKQTQYKMDIFEKCEDPNNVDEFGIEVEYPTNTYYPPGK